MATAKKGAKSPGTALQPWEQRMAEKAQQAAETAKSTGGSSKSINTRNGVFTIDGAEVPDNVLRVVILDGVIDNHMYEDDFDPDEPVPPVCFAFGRNYKTMEPKDEDVADKKHDQCYTCPFGGKDAWGTADKGAGKACKNTRRLLVISEGDLEEDIGGAEVRKLTVPVTSGKAWDGYVKSLEAHRRAPCGVLTEISIVKDPKTQFKLKFTMLGLIDDEYMNEVLDKVDNVQEELFAPYSGRSEDEEEEAPRGRGAGKALAKGAKKAPAKAVGRRR